MHLFICFQLAFYNALSTKSAVAFSHVFYFTSLNAIISCSLKSV